MTTWPHQIGGDLAWVVADPSDLDIDDACGAVEPARILDDATWPDHACSQPALYLATLQRLDLSGYDYGLLCVDHGARIRTFHRLVSLSNATRHSPPPPPDHPPPGTLPHAPTTTDRRRRRAGQPGASP